PPRWDFEMLTLAAFFFHPELEVARAEWNQASAQIITAGARPNPTIAVTPEYDFTPSAGLSPWLPAVQFDFPIETAGKRGHRIAIAESLGLPAQSLAGITFDLNSVVPAADRLPFLTSAEARRRALTGRTDILMALAEYAAAQAALQVEVARQYPDVHLGTGYQWDQGDNKWSIGLGTEIPLL